MEPQPAKEAGGRARLERVCIGAAQDRGARDYMEDRHTIVGDLAAATGQTARDGLPRTYAAVFDGHAGKGAAEAASKHMHELLAQKPAIFGQLDGAAANGHPGADKEERAIAAALADTFREMDKQIDNKIQREGADSYGTTAAVLLNIGEALYTAHAGDSGAVLGRRGAAHRLTEDHKPNLPAELRRIEQGGGEVDEQRNRVVCRPSPGTTGARTHLLAMSRALGDPDYKVDGKNVVTATPDVRRVDLEPGDTCVVVGSDGLWDVMDDQEAIQVVDKVLTEAGRPTKQVATRAALDLVTLALNGGTTDNVTALVVLLDWGAPNGGPAPAPLGSLKEPEA